MEPGYSSGDDADDSILALLGDLDGVDDVNDELIEASWQWVGARILK